MADEETQSQVTSNKYFRWDEEMIEFLIDSLNAIKSEMVFKGLDFDAEKYMQYKTVRCLAMARKYESYGPIAAEEMPANIEDLSAEEQKAIKNKIKISKDLITKADKRVMEKIKDIQQNFSGKLVYEHYDKPVHIWGSTPNVVPLEFGVSRKSFTTPEEQRDQERDEEYGEVIASQLNSLEEQNNSDETCLTLPSTLKTPKRKNVVKLVDNKRRHMERNLSAAQRDQIY